MVTLTHAHPLEIPVTEVARLTRAGRAYRVAQLVARSHELLDYAMTVPTGGRPVVSVAILYSGGNDSTTLAHMFRDRATHAVHANTGVGVEATRAFVRSTCATWGLPLIEEHPPAGRTYRDMVLSRKTDRAGRCVGGFPGPGQHFKAYQWLKESCLDQARRPLGVHRSRTRRAIYVAGRRREESARRAGVPLFEQDGSVVWVSPLAEWTKLDLNTYRLMHPDVPRNEVSNLLHMSGECLCGAFAKYGELEEIGDWFPEVREEIEALERELVDREDIPPHRRRWGWGAYKRWAEVPERRPSESGRLCSSCVAPEETA